jgi:hypothetical protein
VLGLNTESIEEPEARSKGVPAGVGRGMFQNQAPWAVRGTGLLYLTAALLCLVGIQGQGLHIADWAKHRCAQRANGNLYCLTHLGDPSNLHTPGIAWAELQRVQLLFVYAQV